MKTTALVISMALFVVLGAPLVWVVWEAVNKLLTGHPGDVHWALTLPALALLIVLLSLLGRSTAKLGRTTND
ncbi:MAG: hypothetical protein PVF05_03900 [Gemmatimonadales bacterium]